MDFNDDNYIPRAVPSIQAIEAIQAIGAIQEIDAIRGYVSDVSRVSQLRCELVFERADASVFARAFYTRWGWHPVNTRLVGKLWEQVKHEYGLDYLRDISVLNGRGWILTNADKNTTRLSAFAIFRVLREEPVYIDGVLD